MQKYLFQVFSIVFFFIFFVSIFIFPIYLSTDNTIVLVTSEALPKREEIYLNHSEYTWPTPGYYYITSEFGYRLSPTKGASKYHGGIDIGAPQGSNIVAISSGRVCFVGWYGANGYTVILVHDGDRKSIYGHVSPEFLVEEGDYVEIGEVIAKVGPKNVYGQPNNPYKDSNGNPTNGATTGPHLHFSIEKGGKKLDPVGLFD